MSSEREREFRKTIQMDGIQMLGSCQHVMLEIGMHALWLVPAICVEVQCLQEKNAEVCKSDT